MNETLFRHNYNASDDAEYTNTNVMNEEPFGANFNESNFNFTNPFNLTLDGITASNRSRHSIQGISPAEHLGVVLFLFIALGLGTTLIFCYVLFAHKRDLEDIRSFHASRLAYIDREEMLYDGRREEGIRRPDLLSIPENGCADDRVIVRNGNEIPMRDILVGNSPGDIISNYSDSRNSDRLTTTTPLSNTSIITMTMRNNYLIVETEERVPVNFCTTSSDQLHTCTLPNDFMTLEDDEDDYDYHADLLDNLHSYSEELLPISCSMCDEDRQQIYRPTTSKQADEEDQQIELFHKNILAFAPSSSYEQETDTIPSCSCDYNDEESSSSGDGGGAVAHTGFTQSDLTGSSSSTSKQTRTEYGYSNQCEYVSCEFPQRKRSCSLKLLSSEKEEMLMSNYPAYFATATDENTAHDSPSEGAEEPKIPEDSVLQVTSCSSPEFSEPSK